MEPWLSRLRQWLALPQFGLSTVFVVSFLSATLLPLGRVGACWDECVRNGRAASSLRGRWSPHRA